MTVWVPAETVAATEIVKVETAEEVDEENKTLGGFNAVVRPVMEPMAVRSTLPEKPFNPVTVIVEVAVEPATSERDDGLPAIVKSVTTTMTCAERAIRPLIPLPVPVTVTV